MANGYFLSQFQPLNYGPTISGAGAPLAGLMSGYQQGTDMAQQMEEMRLAEAQQEQAALAEEQRNALAMQAAQGDPEAFAMYSALDPKGALQMQQAAELQQKQDTAEDEREKKAIGSMGALLETSSKKNADNVYARAVRRARAEGDAESAIGLPDQDSWSGLDIDQKVTILQDVGTQLSAYALGPEGLMEREYKEQTVGLRQKELDQKISAADKTSLQKNLEAAGLKRGTKEYKDAMLDATKVGTVVNVGPQTEGQRRDEFLAHMVDRSLVEMTSALETFDPTSMASAIVGKLPLSNFFQSESHQKFNSAARPIVEAYLVKLTGAAYTEVQQSGAVDTYMPQPGDKVGNVNAKINRIKDFAKGLKRSAGLDISDAAPDEFSDISRVPAEDLDKLPQQDFTSMSDEDLLKLYRETQ